AARAALPGPAAARKARAHDCRRNLGRCGRPAEALRHVRQMDCDHARCELSALPLDSRRIRARVPGALRISRGAVQDDRLLRARARAHAAVERSRARNFLAAARRTSAGGERPARRAARCSRALCVRILLTGRNGQVGWELERSLAPLGEVIAFDRANLDLSDAATIRRAAQDTKPDVIVNAAAHAAVDRAESEPELADAINHVAPRTFAEEARRSGALLVHYST